MKKHYHKGWSIVCFCALLLMFCSPAIYRMVLYGTETYLNLLWVVLASVPLAFFLTSIRKWWVFLVLSIPMMYFSGNETFVVVVYRHYMKAINVLSMLITNTTESSSFISNNTLAVLCDVPIVVLWIIAIWAKSKSKTTSWKPFAVSAVVLLLFLFLAKDSKVMRLPPYNLPVQYYNAYAINKIIQQEASKPKAVIDCKQTNPKEREAYVLFIGESVVYDHLSLAGYNRKTTPLLDSRDDLTLFTDYKTNATLTMLAAPMMMTDATAEDFFRSYSGVNCLQVFKQCGFKTFVLVCINHLDQDQPLTEAADSVFCVEKDIDIPAVVDSLTNLYPKTFFVIQGLGNHCYFYNFEEEDNQFRPNPYYDPDVQSDSLYYNAYDCTVRYTDRVVDGVIKAIDKENMHSVMLFASDHGENVNPGDERRSVSMNPQESEYHVPLIIWRSQTWIVDNLGKENCILANKDQKTNTDNIFYTLCDVASIQLPDSLSKPEWTITSPAFAPHPRTLLTPDGKTILELE
ncbi:MAG: sulfatase-like hydrolase/transferase [Bacteroidaceae bacterium]|nr:sulfatase-like hydrolase/transferase [Bacteroidaceae bacterium]